MKTTSLFFSLSLLVPAFAYCIESGTTTAIVKANSKVCDVTLDEDVDMRVKGVPLQVRFFDFNKGLTNVAQWKEDTQRINKELEGKANEIKQLDEQLRKNAAELQTMGATLTDSAKEQKTEELMNLQNKIKTKQQSGQSFAERAMQEAQAKVTELVQKEAAEYAVEHGIHLIESNFGPLYASPEIDISQDIATSMNKKYAAQKKKEAEKKKDAIKKPATMPVKTVTQK